MKGEKEVKKESIFCSVLVKKECKREVKLIFKKHLPFFWLRETDIYLDRCSFLKIRILHTLKLLYHLTS